MSNIVCFLFICYLLISFYCAHAVSKAVDTARKFKYHTFSVEDKKKFLPCAHFDIPYWSKIRFVIGGFFFVPIRLFTGSLILAIGCAVCHSLRLITGHDFQDNHLWPQWAKHIIRANIKFMSAGLATFFGVCYIAGYRVLEDGTTVPLEDFSFSRARGEWNHKDANSKAVYSPLIVANHVSMVDTFSISCFTNAGFVAKAAVRDTPFFGLCSHVLRCIFVSRSSADDRDAVLKKIIERQRCLMGVYSEIHSLNGGNTDSNTEKKIRNLELEAEGVCKTGQIQPFVVFPEGTTSNGLNLLPFKRGAFEALLPVTPLVLYYPYTHFNPAYDMFPDSTYMLLTMAEIVNRAQLHMLPPVCPPEPPQNELETPEAREARVLKFATEVRKKMSDYLYYIHQDSGKIPKDIRIPEDIEMTFRDRRIVLEKFYPELAATEARREARSKAVTAAAVVVEKRCDDGSGGNDTSNAVPNHSAATIISSSSNEFC